MPRERILKTLQPPVFRPPRGQKEVWLPNLAITFLRTPNLPSNTASFIVPLSMNKLDLKDYLWHAYNVPVLSVRSYIQQQKLQMDKSGALRPRRNAWHRPRSIKRMIVEMAEGEHGGPFAWPDEIKDYSGWDKEAYDALEDAREKEQMAAQNYKDDLLKETDDEKAVRELAKQMRAGMAKWRPTWMDLGPPIEVEKDVDVGAAKGGPG